MSRTTTLDRLASVQKSERFEKIISNLRYKPNIADRIDLDKLVEYFHTIFLKENNFSVPFNFPEITIQDANPMGSGPDGITCEILINLPECWI